MKNSTLNFVCYLLTILFTLLQLDEAFGQCQIPTFNTNSIPDLTISGCGSSIDHYQDYPFIYSGDCQIGINRYLSRAANVHGLSELIYNDYGVTECIPPYDSEGLSEYCPEKYYAMINSMVEMDAQFLLNAYWGGCQFELNLQDPSDLWCQVGVQVVQDINYAYDCAQKRRPIIQATVLENLNADNFTKAPMYNIFMPTWIICKYFQYYKEDFLDVGIRDYYYFQDANGNFQPRSNLFFTRERICDHFIDSNGQSRWIPQINLVEMRMWFLYEAFTVINMGYTAITMGLYDVYAKDDKKVITGLEDFERLFKLTRTIRHYAKDVKQSFVILCGEPVFNHESPKLGGTDSLIFDFDSRALRPREISNPQVSGDGGCDDPIAQEVLDAFYNSPCSTATYPAISDPCTIQSIGGGSGITPSGCYVDEVPYIVHFDGFSPMSDPPGQPSDGELSSLCWGFHDHHWFSTLESECKQWWLEYFYCNYRNFTNGNGWLTIPGIIIYDTPTQHNNNDGAQFISDDSMFVEKLKNVILAPDTPTIVISSGQCGELYQSNYCNGITLPRNQCFLTRDQCYEITIGNKDCSSIYSFHIKDPNGDWLPQVYGDTVHLCPTIPGFYQIGIRQDNLGLPIQSQDNFGVYGVVEIHHLKPQCSCSTVSPESDCFRNFQQQDSVVYRTTKNNTILTTTIDIYPNPVNDEINIRYSLPKLENIKLTIYDIYGRVNNTYFINTISLVDEFKVDVLNYLPGTYYVLFQTESFNEINKILKF